MPKNILVGDIGSTKSTWWSNSEGNREFLLTGYNPLTQSEEVGTRLFEQLWHTTEGASFSNIWYYGAGVVDKEVANTILTSIKKYFPSAQIEIDSDLLGAARAACGKNAGTLAILGTGSHAAVYDGNRITRQASSLGYLLGDEGGGTDIGKELIKAFFYRQMPEAITNSMRKLVPENRSDFLQQLYHHAAPNQFLAQFAKVAAEHQANAWVQQLVLSRFELFIKNHLLALHPVGPIQVIGSVGTIFAGLFQKALENNDLQPGTFIKDPAQRLFEMHLQYE